MMPDAKPEPQHKWLQRLIGNWDIEAECTMGPDQPPMKNKGKETVRALGDFWIVSEGDYEMPGPPDQNARMKALLTLGYDPTKKKFIGTWIGSVMTNLYVYEGELDSAQKILPLNTTGPAMTDPTKMAKFQDIIEIIDDNNRRFYSQMLGDDGKWQRFMTAHFRRTK